jgi:hypothetical protein
MRDSWGGIVSKVHEDPKEEEDPKATQAFEKPLFYSGKCEVEELALISVDRNSK